MNSVVELFSSMVTVTTILLAIVVLKHWYPKAKEAYSEGVAFDSHKWLCMGIVFSFLGMALDNTYWLLAWSANFIDNTADLTAWFFENGVYFNIPFRQACGIIAAYCHIKAVLHITGTDVDVVNNSVRTACVLGVIYSACLFIVS